jgi:hypothetical protein
MKRTILLLSLCFLGACQSLDIPPKNILTDEDIYNEGGIKAFMVGLYGRLPIDDFNVTNDGDRGGYFQWNNIVWPMLSTGETVNRNNTGIYIPEKGYWSQGYQIIRQANTLIQNLPAYVGVLNGAEEWIAEARFIRAYVYFQLVKRYGGVPLVEELQMLENGDESSLWIARSSHEAGYDFILTDLDYAVQNLPAKSETGRANRYTAAAFKTRVALFAGSIARYGGKYAHTVDGVMLCGIPESKANGYFQQAWDAARMVENSGLYGLYKGNPDLAENFAEVFEKADNSTESIFVRQYDYINYRHSFDAVYCPPRMTTTYGDRYNATLDWVELFDGLPTDPATGHIKTTDNEGNYLVYNSPRELFDQAEPRLQGSILLPGHVYKGIELDIRRGIIKESIDPAADKLRKMSIDDGQNTQSYNNTTDYFKDGTVLETTETVTVQTPYELSNGVKLNKNGMDGPANGGSNNTLTGFHGRKWLDVKTLSVAATKLHESFQTWIDIRYAEVLLNRAEAAIELAQNGVASYGGANLTDDAFACINAIRERAGANLLTAPAELSTAPAYAINAGKGAFVQAPNRALQILRVERYKELAFEHKIYWDLRRWFTFDSQIYNYRRRMLNPFLFAKGATVNENGNPEGKYIYDARVCERANNNLTFATKYYYEKIPDGQLKTNPLLEQNNQY